MAILNNKLSYPRGGTAKRAAWGSFMNFLNQCIKVLEHILFVPLFLWAWGEALYGEWLILFSLIAYLSIADIGVGNFVINKMTQYYAKGDLQNYAKTFRSAFSLYAVVTTVLFLFLLFFAFSTPFLDWLNITIAGENSARISVLILGTYVLLGTLSGIVISLYISVGDYARFKTLTNIREVLLIGFIALTLFLGGGFINVASWYLILLFVFMIFIFVDTRRRYSQINLWATKTDWKLASSFIMPGVIFLMIPLAEMIKVQGSVLIIGSSLGAIAVVIFSVHRTLANLVRRVTSIIQPAIQPELAAGEARGDYRKIQLIHNLFIKLVILLSVSAAIFLFFTGGDIIRAWTGGKIVFQPLLWYIFLISVPITALWQFSAVFQIATNKYKEYAATRLLSALIGLVLALVFVKFWGIVGVLLGFVLVETVLNSWLVPYKTLKIIHDSGRKFLLTLAKSISMAVTQLFFAWFVVISIPNIWLRFFAIGITVVIVGIIFSYFIWLEDNERKITSDFIKRVISRCRRKL